MTEYKSKTVTVNAAPMALFNRFTDLDALLAAVPEQQRNDISVEGDTLRVSYGGFTIAVKIIEKTPFSRIRVADLEAPFHFTVTINLRNGELPLQTELDIELSADLNFMMKALIGGRIQEFLDKAVTAIATGGGII
ncbi:MAG: hypothetical protein MJY49_01015 [Bacteroidales bacterium]|nr:hypothetical protein [Bacteroidales bacterium]